MDHYVNTHYKFIDYSKNLLQQNDLAINDIYLNECDGYENNQIDNLEENNYLLNENNQIDNLEENNLKIEQKTCFSINLIDELPSSPKYPKFIFENFITNFKKMDFIPIKNLNFKNELHKNLYSWKINFNEGKNSTKSLLKILKDNNIKDIPSENEFFKPIEDEIKLEKNNEFTCKFGHKLMVLKIENEINKIFRDKRKCNHLNFVYTKKNFTKNFYESDKYKNYFEKSDHEKCLYLIINLYSDGFRKGRFSKTSLIGTYFSLLNYDSNFIFSNICLINLCNECEDCNCIKNRDITKQFIELNKGNNKFIKNTEN
jgi:hypothetical protein